MLRESEVFVYYFDVLILLPLHSRRKYVDIKCLLCLMKFALMKKCCLNIHIYIYIYIYIYTHTHTHIYVLVGVDGPWQG